METHRWSGWFPLSAIWVHARSQISGPRSCDATPAAFWADLNLTQRFFLFFFCARVCVLLPSDPLPHDCSHLTAAAALPLRARDSGVARRGWRSRSETPWVVVVAVVVGGGKGTSHSRSQENVPPRFSCKYYFTAADVRLLQAVLREARVWCFWYLVIRPGLQTLTNTTQFPRRFLPVASLWQKSCSKNKRRSCAGWRDKKNNNNSSRESIDAQCSHRVTEL